VQDNPSDAFQVVASHLVQFEGSISMRLYYSDALLDGESFVRVTSMLDGDVQELNADELREWSNTSAYFNGDSVLFELVAGPHTSGNFVNIDEVGIIVPDITTGSPGECGICGSDDRSPTGEDYAGRLVPVGCSASIYTTNSCATTAGHCVDGAGALVLQFNVPNSLANCQLVNPASIHQYPVGSKQFNNGGPGADWCVMQIGTSQGLRPYQRYGTLRRITSVAAGLPLVRGYGADNTCTRNQTLQASPGTTMNFGGTIWTYNCDIRGGNSGSGLLSKELLFGVVTHCNTTCGNIATHMGVTAFVNARNAICPPCISDMDASGSVGQGDLGLLLSGFGLCWDQVGFIHATDLNGDGCTGQADLGVLLGDFNEVCP
jgi:hypothetical protein